LAVNFRRSLIIAELWRLENHFVSNFCVFFWKTTPYGKFFKILFRKFLPPHRSTLLCSNVGKSVKSCVICVSRRDQKNKQNFGCLSNCRYCADRAQNLSGRASNIWLTLSQILSKSVLCRRNYSRTREDRFCPIQYLHDRLFEPIKMPLSWCGAQQRRAVQCVYSGRCLLVTRTSDNFIMHSEHFAI